MASIKFFSHPYIKIQKIWYTIEIYIQPYYNALYVYRSINIAPNSLLILEIYIQPYYNALYVYRSINNINFFWILEIYIQPYYNALYVYRSINNIRKKTVLIEILEIYNIQPYYNVLYVI